MMEVMSFEEEYQFKVETEAFYISQIILRSAERYNYEPDLFFNDVIKLAAKDIKRDKLDEIN